MSTIPVVSIILPTYNRAHLLPKAIESVLTQTYPKWELIIWNDGSMDDTEKVVHSFKDHRIRYFSESNHGMSYGLNKAIGKVKGEFIAFLDDDDQWMESKLEIQLTFFSDYPELDLVFGNYQNIDLLNNKEGIGFSQNAKVFKHLITKKIDDHRFIITGGFKKSIAIGNFIHFDSAIIRKDMADRIGNFNEGLRNGMDFEYWWRFGLLGGKSAYTDIIVVNRIKHPSSLSSSSLATIENHLKSLDSCAQQSIHNNCPESIKFLIPQYRNAWQNKILLHGKLGNRKMAWFAFKQSLKFGLRLGSLKLIVLGLISSKKNVF